jgi:hypothetical protein
MVAMNVWPTDGAAGSVANEATWRKMARLWAASGIAVGVGAEMAVTLAFPNLTVRAGACWVDGHFCELTGDQVLTVTASGIVVVRFDPVANTAQLLYLDGVTNPNQSPIGTYELVLAQMSTSILTDRRIPANPIAAGQAPATPIHVTATQTGITTEVAITGLALIFNAYTVRNYRFDVVVNWQSTVVNDRAILSIKDGATVLQAANAYQMVANQPATLQTYTVATGLLPGPHTITTTLQRFAGTGTLQMVASPTSPAVLTVTDLG